MPTPAIKRVKDALKRHPEVPKEVIEKMESAPTGGEAKRILRAWLETQPRKPTVKS